MHRLAVLILPPGDKLVNWCSSHFAMLGGSWVFWGFYMDIIDYIDIN